MIYDLLQEATGFHDKKSLIFAQLLSYNRYRLAAGSRRSHTFTLSMPNIRTFTISLQRSIKTLYKQFTQIVKISQEITSITSIWLLRLLPVRGIHRKVTGRLRAKLDARDEVSMGVDRSTQTVPRIVCKKIGPFHNKIPEPIYGISCLSLLQRARQRRMLFVGPRHPSVITYSGCWRSCYQVLHCHAFHEVRVQVRNVCKIYYLVFDRNDAALPPRGLHLFLRDEMIHAAFSRSLLWHCCVKAMIYLLLIDMVWSQLITAVGSLFAIVLSCRSVLYRPIRQLLQSLSKFSAPLRFLNLCSAQDKFRLFCFFGYKSEGSIMMYN